MTNLKLKPIDSMQSLNKEQLMQSINSICLLAPPAWNLQDIVAVNPFLGYANQPILEAHHQVRSRIGADLLPTLEILKEMQQKDCFKQEQIEAAYSELLKIYGDKFSQFNISPSDATKLLKDLESDSSNSTQVEIHLTLAQRLDQRLNPIGRWRTAIHVDISRFCSMRFDQGVAYWGVADLAATDSTTGLYESWLEYAKTSVAMRARGLSNFRAFTKELPTDPFTAITQMLEKIQLTSGYEHYLSSLLGDLPGWAGFLRQQAWEKDHAAVGELPDLLAIRLAYDLALFFDPKFENKLSINDFFPNPSLSAKQERSGLIKLILLRAAELGYKKEILGELTAKNSALSTPKAPSERSLAQVIFCIDVRSEIIRRHLQSINQKIETFGFAGFFGLFIKLTNHDGSCQSQCPVLLKPSISVNDISSSSSTTALINKVGKILSKAALSCFTYMETVGFLSFFSVLSGLFSRKPQKIAKENTISAALTKAEKLELATGMLKNMGIKAPFGRFLVLCGHESNPTNNPQAAALGCGACGGHSGRVNAQLAAAILNDLSLRPELAKRGWEIPEDCVAVAAVHETITDQVRIVSEIPESHLADLNELKDSLTLAGQRTRLERSARLLDDADADVDSSLTQRAQDISEVRPEWALANNAAFIASTNSTLNGANLKGRTFLHNYDESLDADGSILELILIAPVVVASWINLQYFASTVDPVKFGSGNKALHNILGGVGVICGNDGDLAVGLSWQSVNDGTQIQHQPLRLQVFIEAQNERIKAVIDKHAGLNDLVKNGWILVHSLAKKESTVIAEQINC